MSSRKSGPGFYQLQFMMATTNEQESIKPKIKINKRKDSGVNLARAPASMSSSKNSSTSTLTPLAEADEKTPTNSPPTSKRNSRANNVPVTPEDNNKATTGMFIGGGGRSKIVIPKKNKTRKNSSKEDPTLNEDDKKTGKRKKSAFVPENKEAAIVSFTQIKIRQSTRHTGEPILRAADGTPLSTIHRQRELKFPKAARSKSLKDIKQFWKDSDVTATPVIPKGSTWDSASVTKGNSKSVSRKTSDDKKGLAKTGADEKPEDPTSRLKGQQAEGAETDSGKLENGKLDSEEESPESSNDVLSAPKTPGVTRLKIPDNPAQAISPAAKGLKAVKRAVDRVGSTILPKKKGSTPSTPRSSASSPQPDFQHVAHEVSDHLEDGEYLTVTKDTYDFLVEVNKNGIRPFSTKTKLPKEKDEIQVIHATQVIDHRKRSQKKKNEERKGGNGGVCDPSLGVPEPSEAPIEIEKISKHTVTKTKQGLVIDKNSANIVININESQSNVADTTKLTRRLIQGSQLAGKLHKKSRSPEVQSPQPQPDPTAKNSKTMPKFDEAPQIGKNSTPTSKSGVSEAQTTAKPHDVTGPQRQHCRICDQQPAAAHNQSTDSRTTGTRSIPGPVLSDAAPASSTKDATARTCTCGSGDLVNQGISRVDTTGGSAAAGAQDESGGVRHSSNGSQTESMTSMEKRALLARERSKSVDYDTSIPLRQRLSPSNTKPDAAPLRANSPNDAEVFSPNIHNCLPGSGPPRADILDYDPLEWKAQQRQLIEANIQKFQKERDERAKLAALGGIAHVSDDSSRSRHSSSQDQLDSVHEFVSNEEEAEDVRWRIRQRNQKRREQEEESSHSTYTDIPVDSSRFKERRNTTTGLPGSDWDGGDDPGLSLGRNYGLNIASSEDEDDVIEPEVKPKETAKPDQSVSIASSDVEVVKTYYGDLPSSYSLASDEELVVIYETATDTDAAETDRSALASPSPATQLQPPTSEPSTQLLAPSIHLTAASKSFSSIPQNQTANNTNSATQPTVTKSSSNIAIASENAKTTDPVNTACNSLSSSITSINKLPPCPPPALNRQQSDQKRQRHLSQISETGNSPPIEAVMSLPPRNFNTLTVQPSLGKGYCSTPAFTQIEESASDGDSEYDPYDHPYIPKYKRKKNRLRRMSVDHVGVSGFNTDVGEVPSAPFMHRTVKMKQGELTDNDYAVRDDHILGGGKWGRVFEATNLTNNIKLACKSILYKNPQQRRKVSGYAQRQKEALLNKSKGRQEKASPEEVLCELKLMNELDHPNIVKLYSAFEVKKKGAWLCMEQLHGGELLARITSFDYEPTECDVVTYVKQIVDAVRYMHFKTVLHLDLKPENILCVNTWSTHIKIIDFGLAKFYNENEDQTTIWGTAEFTAPEVFNFDRLRPATDMWSVGVIIYILLTGLSPFLGADDSETQHNVINVEIDYDPEIFYSVSDDAMDFMKNLIVLEPTERLTAKECKRHDWLSDSANERVLKLRSKERLKKYMAKKRWRKVFNLITATRYMEKSASSTSLRGNISKDSLLSSTQGSAFGSNLETLNEMNTLQIQTSRSSNPGTTLPSVNRRRSIHTIEQNNGSMTSSQSSGGLTMNFQSQKESSKTGSKGPMTTRKRY